MLHTTYKREILRVIKLNYMRSEGPNTFNKDYKDIRHILRGVGMNVQIVQNSNLTINITLKL